MSIIDCERYENLRSLGLYVGITLDPDYVRTVDRSREILQNAGLYSDADFEMLKQRATDISMQTAETFCDVMPRIVFEYIDSRQ